MKKTRQVLKPAEYDRLNMLADLLMRAGDTKTEALHKALQLMFPRR
jgi:hypothetical protein